ncbi:lipoprotein-releasing ABC transporter permease subunit LolE [Candidatus Steffania adelgidicola]|uniref:lipoprotein-releasing ABC transporter permease subunit LolE n=1 Tax=Candidatus Steffania adelgidicola TaxID=1076626 RepID=UPI001D02AAD8|nr:lipoprotein-releasing ABC transporter permease subunit LolE [Candidatus Steffania adelgidicola]UDG79617.1 Lipoprotein-releasing system transmembrane protein LolE [Candidatus Steffania adelgidicola]
MKIPLSLKIAFRFSQGRQWGDMPSLISIISTLGIALGVAALIIGLSTMNGFERALKDRILSVVPHGEIEPMTSHFDNWERVLKRIRQVPGILAAAPYLNFSGLVERDDKFQAIQIKSVDPVLEMKLSGLPDYVQNNAWSDFQAGRKKIIIGKKVGEMLKVKPGDWLTVMIPNTNPQMQLLQPKWIHLQVSGILALTTQMDHGVAIVPLADAQKYLNYGKDIGGIAIKVNDVFDASNLVRKAGKVTNTYVKIRSWMDSYGYMYHDIQTIRGIMYVAIILVIGVACFNIISTLVMAVKDKSVDIAILGTLGSQDGLIRSVFIWYGLLAGLTGSVIGTIVGVLISLNLTILVKEIEQILGCHLLSSDIYFIDFVPSELHLVDVISVLATALLLSLFASWYPARCASRISPAKALST